MSPEQKAKELVEKFDKLKLYNAHAAISEEKEHAKQCALICVDEIIESVPMSPAYDDGNIKMHSEDFWADVKYHLQKL